MIAVNFPVSVFPLVYLVAVTYVTYLYVAYDDSCDRYDVNGCSIPYNIHFPYKKTFTPACNRHDICYSCGYLYGISRYNCDAIFHTNMQSMCKLVSWWSWVDCHVWAFFYWNAVRVGSAMSDQYKTLPTEKSKYCDEEWVQVCAGGKF